jgi:hypothetical protein
VSAGVESVVRVREKADCVFEGAKRTRKNSQLDGRSRPERVEHGAEREGKFSPQVRGQVGWRGGVGFNFYEQERERERVSPEDGVELQNVRGKRGVEGVRVGGLVEGCHKVKRGL